MHLKVILERLYRAARSVFSKTLLVKRSPLHFSGGLRIGENFDARVFLSSNIVNFGCESVITNQLGH